jgi:hypothetical protein
MKYLITLVIVFLAASFVFSEVNNVDNPANGEWNLQLKKEWEISKAGDMFFNRPDKILASDDELLYVKDIKYRIIHMFDNRGKFIKSFGKKGEGPGELKHHKQIYFVDNLFIAADRDRLHYFKKDAIFIHSVINYWYRNIPKLFLNPQECIVVHRDPKSIPFKESKGIGNIILLDLKTNSRRTLTEFQYLKKGQIAFITKELTPRMIIGYNRTKKIFYYGMNDAYVVNMVDINGKPKGSFSVDRAKAFASGPMKEKIFAHFKRRIDPATLKRQIEKTLDELVYFYRIEVINGFVFIFNLDTKDLNHPGGIDIFSPEGKYLYKTTIKTEENFTFFPSPYNNIVFKNNSLYIAVEDDNDGDVKIVKYKVTLPSG